MDAVLFFILFLGFIKQGNNNSGGREMGLFFCVLVPSIVLLGMMLLFVFSYANVGKYIALFIVAGPGLFIASAMVRNSYIDCRVMQNRLGRGYFSGGTMEAMGAAIVRGDLDEMRKLGSKVQINYVARTNRKPGMTFMRLAVENAQRCDGERSSARDLAVVKLLLELGAEPDSGLDDAVRIKDGAILGVLLNAGADANLKYNGDQAIVFRWLTAISRESFRQLATHGLNLNVFERDEPLCVMALFSGR